MDDDKAFELIDAHLDRHTLNDDESDELTSWIKSDPARADAAFFRVFLHSYLRFRIQAGLPAPETSSGRSGRHLIDVSSALRLDNDRPVKRRRSAFWAWGLSAVALTMLVVFSVVAWQGFAHQNAVVPDLGNLWAYEGFDYPSTNLPRGDRGEVIWPTSGGLHGLEGGIGWSEPWRETNSKVAVVVDYERQDNPWQQNDMRKFGPLSYTDVAGNSIETSGHQARTATTPRSITARRFDFRNFPESFRDDGGIGRDGSVVWFSFLAQSSASSAVNNQYSYLVIGSKDVSGFRVGKLGAAPAGNWTAVGLLTGAEVNLKTSDIPSGQKVFIVARIEFREGSEEALIWIDPALSHPPDLKAPDLRLEIPDFRFDGIAIHANHSTDFDEIRFGSSFEAVSPHSHPQ